MQENSGKFIMPMIHHTEHLEQRKESLLNNSMFSEDLFALYQSLYSLQFQSLQHLASIITDSKLIVDTTQYPMIQPHTLQFTDEIIADIKKMFKNIAALITQYQTAYSFDTLLANLDDNPELYKDIITALLSKDSTFEAIAHNNKLDTDELIFVTVNAYKPLFIALKDAALQDITQFPDYSEGLCPFCGFLPDMAKIVEPKNNKRFLHCALCECEWEYKRVKCVACGNENTDTLGYYSYEPDEKYRFDYCNKCNTYIKTIRITKQHDESQFDLTVENLITNFLDASALQMGYTRQ